MKTDSLCATIPDGAPVAALGARRCVACDGTDTRPHFRGLVQCAGCGLIFYPKRLSAEEVSQLYSEEYFQGAEYFRYLEDRPVHEANFRARVRQLEPWLAPGKSVFEVGCSYGFFLNVARDRWRVRGCDIAREPAAYARRQLGLDVQCADFHDVELRPGEVDAFCLWDTIEHLEDPAPYLARMAEVLEPGGIVALTTGDIGSWLARRQGPRWRQIHPPTHLWYFSRQTMGRMLERFGFELVSFGHIGLRRSLGQIVYSLSSLKDKSPSRLHRWCMKLGLGGLPVWLNTFDLMMVVARRTAEPAPTRE